MKLFKYQTWTINNNKMGCAPSKAHKNKLNNNDLHQSSECNEDCADCDSDQKLMNIYDEEVIGNIRKDLNERPEMFVLNNVLMATFFMGNYKKEIYELFNTRLENPHDLIEPDLVIEKANNYVIYRPLHGPNQDHGESFITKRIYVPVNHAIEIVQSFDNEENWCDNEKFKIKMEDSHKKGYVNLRELNTSSVPFDDLSQIDFLSVPTATSSGSSDTDTISDTISAASSISDLRVPQPIIDGDIKNENRSLNYCFVYRKVKKPDIDMDLEDMDAENLTDDDVYDIVPYLSSQLFMKYFQCEIFHRFMEQILDRDGLEMGNRGWLPGKIFCNMMDTNENDYLYEILPCLTMSWPEDNTFEFLNCNPKRTWPTEQMLQEIKQLNCVLIPKPHLRKPKGIPLQKDLELEWEINFPLAEKYLDTFLSSAQMKCFLVLLAIHKEYIEPYTKQDGLLPEHIRHHIYWECQQDSSGWAEHRLGLKLLSVIYNLSAMLRKRGLRDFFIQKKNLFKHISRKYLLPSTEVFHRISQSPLMMTIGAIRNLRHKSGKFYPPFDFKELIRILKIPENSNSIIPNTDKEERLSNKKPKVPMFQDAEKQLRYVKVNERKQKMMQKLKQKQERQLQKNLRKKYYSMIVENDETDDIDDLWKCEKSFDISKKAALLELFIRNFIDIAKVSSRIDTNKRTMFYLKQAYYLTRILEEDCAVPNEEIQDFYSVIKQEETKCMKEGILGFVLDRKSSSYSLSYNNNLKRPSENSVTPKSARNSGQSSYNRNTHENSVVNEKHKNVNNENGNNHLNSNGSVSSNNISKSFKDIETDFKKVYVKKLGCDSKIDVESQNIDRG